MAALPPCHRLESPVGLPQMLSGQSDHDSAPYLSAVQDTARAARDAFDFLASDTMQREAVEPPDQARRPEVEGESTLPKSQPEREVSAAEPKTKKRKQGIQGKESSYRERRRTSNRIAARKSRALQKQRLSDLEAKVSELTKEIASLTQQLQESEAREDMLLGRVSTLTAELALARARDCFS